jgi:hypothetical protein
VKSLDPETLRASISGQQNMGTIDRCGEIPFARHARLRRNVCILRAVNEIASGVASIPIDVYSGTDKQEKSDLGALLPLTASRTTGWPTVTMV